MVDPGCGARCAIRDTGAPGVGQGDWGRSLGILAYVEGGEPSSRGRDNRSLARLFWHVLDRLDYWLTQARLWLADAVCGPRLDGDPPD